MKDLFYNTGHLAVIILGISVLLCSLKFIKLSTPYKRLFYFLILNFSAEVASRIIVFQFPGVNNLPLLHLYTLGEFILLSWFFKSLIKKPKILQSRFWLFMVIGSILIVLNSLFYQNIYEFNSLAKACVQIIIITYSVLYFYNLTENTSLKNTNEKSLRLINSAILIYYSGSLFIFMFSQVFFENSELHLYFWTFNAILNVVFQLLVLVSLWKVIFKKPPLYS